MSGGDLNDGGKKEPAGPVKLILSPHELDLVNGPSTTPATGTEYGSDWLTGESQRLESVSVQ